MIKLFINDENKHIYSVNIPAFYFQSNRVLWFVFRGRLSNFLVPRRDVSHIYPEIDILNISQFW